MINKYQAGGAAPQGGILQEIAKLPQDQQKKIMTAFGKWAQAKGLNLQQLQGNESALEQAMGQFLQEMQASQAPKARLGAKLNYIRELKGNAPEGMEVVYYKCGGQMKKKFVKAAGGAKAKDGKKEIADFKKKKACGGSKMKFADGGKADNKKWTKEDDKKLLKYRLKGTKNPAEKKDSTEVQTKWNKLPEKEKAKYEVKEKCGGKVKKHQQGGSLNRIPFYQGGTSKEGILMNKYKKPEIQYSHLNNGRNPMWYRFPYPNQNYILSDNDLGKPGEGDVFVRDERTPGSYLGGTKGGWDPIKRKARFVTPKKFIGSLFNTWEAFADSIRNANGFAPALNRKVSIKK